MTEYVFAPQSYSNEFVDWGDPAIWAGGVVPNAPDADVLIPTITQGDGSAAPFFIAIDNTAYTENSVAVGASNYVLLYSAMSVGGAFDLGAGSELDMYGGTLTVGTLTNGGYDIQGDGLIDVGSTFDNTGDIVSGSLTTVNADGFDNTGTLIADFGVLAVTVTGGAGSAQNLSGGTLSGGTYDALSGTLELGFGGAITTDNAVIDIGGSNTAADGPLNGTIVSVTSSGQTLDLQSTLGSIAAQGTLEISSDGIFADAGTLTIGGSVQIDGGTLNAASLVLAASGTIAGAGTVLAPLTDNGGTVLADTGLVLAGPVSGSGALVIAAAGLAYYGGRPPYDWSVTPNVLELDSRDSVGVNFASGAGTLILNDVQEFTGTITASQPEFISDYAIVAENIVQVGGIAIGSVTGETYTATGPDGGILTLSEGSLQQTLHFAGDFTTASFALSAGPQPLSSSPPSLDITITPVPPAPTLASDGSATGLAAANAIIDSSTPTLSGMATAGSTVFFFADGVADGEQALSSQGDVGTSTGAYSATLSTLALGPGLHSITAIAENAAGATSAAGSVTVFVLPDPVNGTVTAAADSLALSSLMGSGFALQLSAATEAVDLTNGTLSVGPDTNAAFLQRLYEGLLDRPGDTPGLTSNAAALATAGTAAIASDFLASSEFTVLHPDIGGLTNSGFVTFLYESFLGRAPDAQGLAAFTAALQTGASRGAVTASIANSDEAKTDFAQDTANVWVPDKTGTILTELYRTALDRPPDAGGFQAALNALHAGATLLQIAQGIVASPEYATDHAGQSDTGLITSFYEDGLGRAPDPGGLAADLSALAAGASQAEILLGIASSPEAAMHLPVL